MWAKGRRRGSFSLSLSFYVLLLNISKEFCFISVWKSEKKSLCAFHEREEQLCAWLCFGQLWVWRSDTPADGTHSTSFPCLSNHWLVVLEVLVKAGYPTPHTCLLLDQECCQRRELVQLAPNNPHHLLPTTSFPCLLREDLRLLRHAPGVCLFPF